jgi:glycosyltransferase involved in cell wall biosynthesis
VADRWGDWHLAEALARSLRRLGQDVDVQTHDLCETSATRSHDVHLVLHGLAAVRRTPGQRHVLWVISHPETLDTSACDDADLVLVASKRFAASLRDRTTTPVEVLLQATDPGRFRPVPPREVDRHPVTVVAKTRDVLRPIVADALSVGIRPSIYGSGWRGLVDPDLVRADHVDNERLAAVYCGAGVVLNDHWDTMRAWGFVSNRIFDVLACGVPVISDHVEELGDLFGEAVLTYRTPEELAELVRGVLAEPEAARARAMAGRAVVLEHHTFDHRARELLELVARHTAPGHVEQTRAQPRGPSDHQRGMEPRP